MPYFFSEKDKYKFKILEESSNSSLLCNVAIVRGNLNNTIIIQNKDNVEKVIDYFQKNNIDPYNLENAWKNKKHY
ncbi:hypothetical protein [Spiroplasma endosymbiont of Amphibalanus improvisus]|uniref:hypothetical protein n=1 Tax=Spiroplasma endosymbiont of Amphibalanus improvisus TaxID=3066327 RepID=UPI00313C6EEF